MLLASTCSNLTSTFATTPPAITNITAVTAVTRVCWTAAGNGYNRCVSFTDGGTNANSISPAFITIKYWYLPNQYMSFDGFLTPNRHYVWRISNGVMYVRWHGSSANFENAYPLHPYGTGTQYGYALIITRKDVDLTVDGLSDTFALGTKIPLIPISGGSGEFIFSGPSDMTGSAEANTGLWARPIEVNYLIP